jgi:DHA1 family tetracycline resistance protein-like MFS transporter
MPESTGPRRAALAFIFITVLLDVLALGVIIPVLPKLVVDFTGGDQARAAKIYGLFGTVWAAMQLVCSPIFGSLSDRFGRRKVILVSNFGLAFDYVVMALAPTWQWLFAGRVVSGITASSIPTAYAYIADVTPPEKRSASFGLVGGAFGVGFVLGPAMGGILGQVNPRLPFWVSAGLSFANAMYGLFVLPESLAKDRRASFSWKRANPIGSLTFLAEKPGLLGLSLVNFLGYIAHVVYPSVFVLYVGYRYAWNERTVGLVLALVGVSSMIVQGGLMGPTIRRLGERNTLLIGIACGVAGFLVMGFAPNGTVFFWSMPLAALWGLAGPAAMGMMAARVGGSEQGQLQGANNSLRAISELIGPSVFTLTFAYFIGGGRQWHAPGAPFILAAALLGSSIMLALSTARALPRPLDMPAPGSASAKTQDQTG